MSAVKLPPLPCAATPVAVVAHPHLASTRVRGGRTSSCGPTLLRTPAGRQAAATPARCGAKLPPPMPTSNGGYSGDAAAGGAVRGGGGYHQRRQQSPQTLLRRASSLDRENPAVCVDTPSDVATPPQPVFVASTNASQRAAVAVTKSAPSIGNARGKSIGPPVRKPHAANVQGRARSAPRDLRPTMQTQVQSGETVRGCTEPLPSQSSETVGGGYRYVVQFGNNSGVIRQIIRNRQVWMPAPGDPASSSGSSSYQDKRVKLKATVGPEINFLWSQYKCAAFINAMASRKSGLVVTLNEEKTIKLKVARGGGAREGGERCVPPAASAVLRAHNHFEGCGLLCTKRGFSESLGRLFFSIGRDPYGAIPLTFAVRGGSDDPSFASWRQAYQAFDAEAGQRIWIVKPGEWGNRGCGIRIFNDIEEVMQRVDSKKDKGWVIQKYIERPFLVHKRKFDIRAYCLVVQEPNQGPLRAFAYRDGYLRTTSTAYTTKSFDRMIHLNNDAVQKNGEAYGKFESANKMSFDEFQKYLDEHHRKENYNVRQGLVSRMWSLMADAVHSVSTGLNPRGIDNCFEVYGFDFMVDASFRPWLIECNANPCLDLCCAYLSHLIPSMLDQALRLTLDRFVPAGSAGVAVDQGGEAGTKWDLIFDSSRARDSSTIASSWVEALPEGFADARGGADVDRCAAAAVLGRAIICPAAGSKRRRAKAKLEAGKQGYSEELEVGAERCQTGHGSPKAEKERPSSQDCRKVVEDDKLEELNEDGEEAEEEDEEDEAEGCAKHEDEDEDEEEGGEDLEEQHGEEEDDEEDEE
eukprot:TRINITY_DN56706_c0_g1_i1.p1 TRINITY_DN56706_c0_g1~~TRINITY_DN56706_c0_g1_i1.p1  ORF type:complete len:806 (+),score=136.27 TRINITY_DN56706_c0_g1_i1:239-2656(+)